MDAPAPHRRPWLASLLAVFCNGLGHLYAGRIATGFALQAAWLAASVPFAYAARSGIGAASAVLGAMLAYWVTQAVWAARTARVEPPSRQRPALRVLALIGFYVGATAASSGVTALLRRHVVQTFAVSSASMAPTMLVGDWLVTERSVGIERGEVILHSPPLGAASQDPILRRVVALAGDTVEVRNGQLVLNGVPAPRQRVEGPCAYASRASDGTWRRDEPCLEFIEGPADHAYRTYCTPALPCGDVPAVTVPPGHVFLLGDHRDHAADSRVYGPIAESAIIGRVKYVYLSLGPDGVRGERIGMEVR
jgi:signal peptidase I